MVDGVLFDELAVNTIQGMSLVLKPDARRRPLYLRNSVALAINFYQGKSPAADMSTGIDPEVHQGIAVSQTLGAGATLGKPVRVMSELPDFAGFHGVKVQFQFKGPGEHAAFLLRTHITIVEQQYVSVRQLSGRVLVKKLVARVREAEITPRAAQTPLYRPEVGRDGYDLVQVTQGHENITLRAY